MPNWCSNWATIRGPKEELIKLKEAYDNQEFCNAVIPVPQSLKDTVAGSLGDPEEQKKLEAQTQANIREHGYGNWYDFCVNRWGTKWDVGGDGGADLEDSGECLTISFDSAWAPPVGVYEALVERGFDVDAMYYESGCGFAGRYTNGSDDCMDLSNMTIDDIEDSIDPDLNECFGITESMREYEAMNAEDEELYNWVKDGADKMKLVTQ